MTRPKITEERIHTDHVQFPDWIELGRVGSRVHISFNADDLDHAVDRIDNALVARDYGINALMKAIEKEVPKKHTKL